MFTVSHGRDAGRSMQGGRCSRTGIRRRGSVSWSKGEASGPGGTRSDAQWRESDAIRRCDGSHASLTFVLGIRVMLGHTHAIALSLSSLRGRVGQQLRGLWRRGQRTRRYGSQGSECDVPGASECRTSPRRGYFKPEAGPARCTRLRLSAGAGIPALNNRRLWRTLHRHCI